MQSRARSRQSSGSRPGILLALAPTSSITTSPVSSRRSRSSPAPSAAAASTVACTPIPQPSPTRFFEPQHSHMPPSGYSASTASLATSLAVSHLPLCWRHDELCAPWNFTAQWRHFWAAPAPSAGAGADFLRDVRVPLASYVSAHSPPFGSIVTNAPTRLLLSQLPVSTAPVASYSTPGPEARPSTKPPRWTEPFGRMRSPWPCGLPWATSPTHIAAPILRAAGMTDRLLRPGVPAKRRPAYSIAETELRELQHIFPTRPSARAAAEALF